MIWHYPHQCELVTIEGEIEVGDDIICYSRLLNKYYRNVLTKINKAEKPIFNEELDKRLKEVENTIDKIWEYCDVQVTVSQQLDERIKKMEEILNLRNNDNA